ncbi:50S ribosomal protein L11 methyltransferase [Dolosicoccus paucivorans]|uniref:50S ribosomal protein L11 methyltransferase n=1 Tax=Dolosicoccus paucivorans TaxID=84521 RepID=UPI0008844376|nr:50S ribosomal protein L11 methyltransferase [Dolosicoccus paucivorans]SDI30579.1 [LSU ribosomal protein L11P]-lysine N-methyltransferase [Dolosicoccus paucivorans]
MQQWHQVTLIANNLSDDTIDYINYLYFELGATGTQVKYATDYLKNTLNLFGTLEDPLTTDLDRPTQIEAYFDELPDVDRLEKKLESYLEGINWQVETTTVQEENWQEGWMEHYHPEMISRFLTIVPEWYDYTPSPGEEMIRINPGLSFGTGNHPTTKLGAQALEMVMRGGEVVLDVGTGSGILSFVAQRFGARYVYGYDLDPQAIESARGNLIHQTSQAKESIEFYVNDLLKGIDHEADIIVANILPHILVHLFEDAKRLLKPKGHLILGGIIDDQTDFIEEKLDQFGWQVVQKMTYYEWTGYIVQLKKEG